MTVHESKWRGMTLEERVDSLRITVIAQEVWIRVLIQGLRDAGINVVMTDEPDQPGE